MKTTISNGEIKRQNRVRIAKYILEHERVSRQEIAVVLGFSLPTVFQNVTELIEWGLVCEAGEYGSTGGRKAKILKIQEDFRVVAGVEISAGEVRMVLLDLSWRVLDAQSAKLSFSNTQEYYLQFGETIQAFIKKNKVDAGRLVGVGISIPGVVDHDLGMLRQSRALGVANVSIRHFTQNIPYEFRCENDASNAAYAEMENKPRNAVYLCLGDTVGGAVYIGDDIYRGDNYKSAQFGHLVLHPDGAPCYCGKRGCLDAYCSARALKGRDYPVLEQFFAAVEAKEEKARERWDTYLLDLAIAVSNLRAAFDCDVILGGKLGGWVGRYLADFEAKLRDYDLVDLDLTYLHIGSYQEDAAAIGAAKRMVDKYISNLDAHLGK